MPNIKILEDEDLRKLKEIYSFKYVKEINSVMVIISNYSKQTAHDISKDFIINAKKFGKKLTISKEAIKFWLNNTNYNLLDIQNAINRLNLMYQKVTYEKIKEIIK